MSRITCVPTHALELVEFAAARDGAERRSVEPRVPPEKPLDVLVQHMVTVAVGSGFEPDALLAEVRRAWSYRTLTDEEWAWALSFCGSGGSSLQAYEQYRRIVGFGNRMICGSNEIARRHRMSIGTIASDASISVHFLNGHRLGTVEEGFIARMKRGDAFHFGGRTLEFVRVKGMKAYVRPARSVRGTVPRWAGGRMPLSSEISDAMRRMVDTVRRGTMDAVEMDALAPVFELQAAWSAVPAYGETLVERARSREGYHVFLYPFEGRLVHEGLAALMAWRMGRIEPITFTLSCNDYGIEFLSAEPAPLERALAEGLFETDGLVADVEASLNASELARRQFREIARIAGLVFTGYPGRVKGTGQIQASSSLIFDVLERYDRDNLLLEQARREVRERQLEIGRLERTLVRLAAAPLTIVDTERFSPLAFPILVDRLSQRVSSERLETRIERMRIQLERAADRSLSPRNHETAP